METALTVTLGMFFAGIIYAAGRLSSRVESLEEWRRTMEPKLDAIHAAIRQVQHAVDPEDRS